MGVIFYGLGMVRILLEDEIVGGVSGFVMVLNGVFIVFVFFYFIKIF